MGLHFLTITRRCLTAGYGFWLANVRISGNEDQGLTGPCAVDPAFRATKAFPILERVIATPRHFPILSTASPDLAAKTDLQGISRYGLASLFPNQSLLESLLSCIATDTCNASRTPYSTSSASTSAISSPRSSCAREREIISSARARKTSCFIRLDSSGGTCSHGSRLRHPSWLNRWQILR